MIRLVGMNRMFTIRLAVDKIVARRSDPTCVLIAFCTIGKPMP